MHKEDKGSTANDSSGSGGCGRWAKRGNSGSSLCCVWQLVLGGISNVVETVV